MPVNPLSPPLRILVGMICGALLGLFGRVFLLGTMLATPAEDLAYFVGQLFLRLILMVVLPLVVSSLILGVLEMGDVRSLGRIGWKCLMFTLILSTISVLVGIAAVELVKPGQWVTPEARQALGVGTEKQSSLVIQQAQQAQRTVDMVLDLLPRNPVRSAVEAMEGGMISLMSFSLILGLAITMTDKETTQPLVGLLEGILAVSMTVIDFAMLVAPFGVAGLIYLLVIRTGGGLLVSLAGYVFVVIGALAFHQFVIYGIMLKFVAGVSPIKFFKESREAALTAFSTASSAASLPTVLRISEEQLKIPRAIGRFVLTVGATANQNGTALFEGITVLFLAQVYGVELGLSQQVQVMAMSILAGVGTAGVPGGSIPMVIVVMNSVGIPAGGIGIVLGVDRLLDMCRTTLNVTGDLVIAQLVASTSKLDPE